MIRTIDRVAHADVVAERFLTDPPRVRCAGCRCALATTWERIGLCLICARRRGIESPEEREGRRRTGAQKERDRRARERARG